MPWLPGFCVPLQAVFVRNSRHLNSCVYTRVLRLAMFWSAMVCCGLSAQLNEIGIGEGIIRGVWFVLKVTVE